MSELPSGTVTFLFTDIEDSTRLLTALGDHYPEALARHHEILRQAIAHHEGVEVLTEGDAFFVVFRSPIAAVRTAAEIQRALNAEPWPERAEVRVRIGIHTGEAVISGENYVGLDVHRAARIASAAHGGQVLISEATRALVVHGVPETVSVLDLGRHRLKGLPAPEHIFELRLHGLPGNFPPLRTLEVRPHNLPAPLTSFIGREQQVADIARLLRSARLLTLTGPGGTGKTRLAIHVAEDVVDRHPDGAWFVALDALRDPELVPSTIADVLHLKVPPDQPALSALESSLAAKDMLLVLDNVEHLTGSAPAIARLLEAAPHLRVLATSRVPLGLYGEQEYAVPPLLTAGEAELAESEAVRLFVDRALAVNADFRLTDANRRAVVEICARLDGLPLAIELAAARIKLLTPKQIVARLDQSLALLANSAPNVPPRQRTLRGAIEWSCELLDEDERRLFARLSVFRGSFSLDAVEQVAGDDTTSNVLEGVSSLVAKSLLRVDSAVSESRYAMLQVIRDYARERLTASGDERELLRRHSAHFFAVATAAEAQLLGPDQLAWLDRLDRDHDNLRAAFERAADIDMLDEALDSAGAIWRFWQLRARFAEARAIFERLLAQPGAGRGARARALTGAGGIAYWQTDYEAMSRHYREARELYEAMGDTGRLADAVYNEAYVPMMRGTIAESRPLLERAIGLYREAGRELAATEAEWFLGFTWFVEGQPEVALPLSTRAVDAYRAAGARWNLADRLIGLSNVQAAVGQWEAARASIHESLLIFRELGNELGQAILFEAVGNYWAWLGESELAARLLGKAERIKEQLGGGAPSQLFLSDAYRAKARRELGPSAFDRLLAEGAEMSTDDAAALVETFRPAPDAPPVQRL